MTAWHFLFISKDLKIQVSSSSLFTTFSMCITMAIWKFKVSFIQFLANQKFRKIQIFMGKNHQKCLIWIFTPKIEYFLFISQIISSIWIFAPKVDFERKSMKILWKWDFWCNFQPLCSLHCKKVLPSYSIKFAFVSWLTFRNPLRNGIPFMSMISHNV